MIVVNLFGGPGCGKSTGAAHIFSRLKQSGVSCELVTEVAKGYVWDGALNLLHDQTLVLAQQYHNLRRLEGLVDVAITDSPIILSNIYLKNDPKWGVGTYPFELFSYTLNNQFYNRNYFLRRFRAYERVGRCESEEDARKLDDEIRKLLGNAFYLYKEVDGNSMGYEQIVSDVLDTLRSKGQHEKPHGNTVSDNRSDPSQERICRIAEVRFDTSEVAARERRVSDCPKAGVQSDDMATAVQGA